MHRPPAFPCRLGQGRHLARDTFEEEQTPCDASILLIKVKVLVVLKVVILGRARFTSFLRDREGILPGILSCSTDGPLASARVKWCGPIPSNYLKWFCGFMAGMETSQASVTALSFNVPYSSVVAATLQVRHT